MPKLKITQKQYNSLLLNEQKTRLDASETIIIEELNENIQVLEEGWKEVVLGVAMMLGIGLTGQNKIQAQNAVKNQATMDQIKATLEDSAKTKELVELLKEKGMKDPETKLSQNAEKVIDTFNKIAKNEKMSPRLDIKTVNTIQALKGELGSGYAIKNANISTDTINPKIQKEITVQDTMDIEFGSDNLFVTGGFTLSPAGTDTITVAMDEIKKQGGKILSVEVESSTDAERAPKFITKDDETGNITLADLRTKSVTNLIQSIGGDVPIRHREIPNNGSHVVNTQEFIKNEKDRDKTNELRAKTLEFRYVKVKIIAVFDNKNIGETNTPKFITHYRFELVKVIESTGKARKISTKTHFEHKKWKCSNTNGHRTSVKCTTF